MPRLQRGALAARRQCQAAQLQDQRQPLRADRVPVPHEHDHHGRRRADGAVAAGPHRQRPRRGQPDQRQVCGAQQVHGLQRRRAQHAGPLPPVRLRRPHVLHDVGQADVLHAGRDRLRLERRQHALLPPGQGDAAHVPAAREQRAGHDPLGRLGRVRHRRRRRSGVDDVHSCDGHVAGAGVLPQPHAGVASAPGEHRRLQARV